MASEHWKLNMKAEPVIPAWSTSSHMNTNGSELQRAIIKGFAENPADPIWAQEHNNLDFEKIFTFKEHGAFFRGALTMAGLRYTRDFYDLLERYGSIKVTIQKRLEKE